MPATDLPTFLVIGAAKCGTTSLAAYLGAHPQIDMAMPKELNFFSFHWELGIDSYKRRFAGLNSAIRGEASPSYTRAPLIEHVPERIASVIPEIRLVYLIRNPIDRIRSEYLHRLHHGKETARTLSEAIMTNPRYFIVSRYGYQLDQYLGSFEREQILVITAETLMSDRVRTLQEVLRFVGADDSLLPGNLDQELNTGEEKLRIPRVLDPLRSAWSSGRSLTGRVPRKWRTGLKTRLGRQIDRDSTVLTEDQQRDIWSELQPDLIRLREIVGPSLELWSPEKKRATPQNGAAPL